MSAEGAVRAGRVLVTGAGGFVGANVVWALREQGFAVRALVRRPPRGPKWTGLDGVEFTIGDILNPSQVAGALEKVTAVIHTAALTRVIPRPAPRRPSCQRRGHASPLRRRPPGR